MNPITAYKKQTNESGDNSFSPCAHMTTCVVRVSGVARNSTIAINPDALQAGDIVRVLIILLTPSVSGIVMEIQNTTKEAARLFTFTSDGIQPNALICFVADGVGGLDLVENHIPAFIQ